LPTVRRTKVVAAFDDVLLTSDDRVLLLAWAERHRPLAATSLAARPALQAHCPAARAARPALKTSPGVMSAKIGF